MKNLENLTNKELLQLYRLLKEHMEFILNEEKKLKEVDNQ